MPKNVLESPQVGTPSSAWRFRIDTWDFLSYAAKQLVTPAPGGGAGIQLHSEIRRLLTTAPPALPDFSHFAERYRCHPETPHGDLRAAFFDTYETVASEYLSATDIGQRLVAGEEVISAGFVTPYPPGFPILVPGQTITPGILDFMSALGTREIHGYDHEFGFRVMTPESAKDLGED